MMPSINFGRSYLFDGNAYATLADAQRAALLSLLALDQVHPLTSPIIATLLGRKVEAVNILTMADSSRPKARGQRKPRKAQAPTAATQEGGQS